jgi:predicted secreted hydrolase
MADGSVGVKQATTPDRFIDNEIVLNDVGDSVYRQRVAVADLGVVIARLTSILAAVDGLEVTTDQISIDAGTINLSTDQVETLLAAIRDRVPPVLDGDGGLKVHLQNTDEAGVTDAQLRATPVSVTGTVTANLGTIDGAATETTLAAQSAKIPNQAGAWAYYAGTSGTVNVTAGQRVLGIAAHATTAGSMTINAGASVPIPAGTGIQFSPVGNLVAPTLVLTGTDSYVIEVVSG